MKRLLPAVVGVLILAWIVSITGVDGIISVLSTADLNYFLLAGLFYLLAEYVSGKYLQIVYGGSVLHAMVAHMKGMVYSTPTPGRVGYFWVAHEMSKKRMIRLAESVGTLTVLQGFSFIVKAFLSLTATAYFISYYALDEGANYLVLASLMPLFFAACIIVFFKSDVITKKLKHIKYASALIEPLHEMTSSRKKLSTEILLKLSILSVLGWVARGLQWYALSNSLSLDIPLLTCLMMQTLLTAIMFAPILPSGLGAAEGGAVILFNIMGVGAAAAIAYMIAIRINTLTVDFLGFLIRFRRG